MEEPLLDFAEARKEQTMTSKELADIVGKQHKHVMEAIRKMEPAWKKVSGSNFRLATHTDAQGKQRPHYELTKEESLFVATKFKDEARAKLIVRWKNLETGVEQPMHQQEQQPPVPKTSAEMLLLYAQQMVESEKRMNAIESKQQQIEEKVSEIAIRTKTDIKYTTIVGFAKRYGIELPLQKAATLGTVAKNLCRQYLLETGTVPDPRFGSVRTYPDSVLYETFEKYYPTVRFR